MAKEHLLVEVPDTIPEPYRGYMRQRNRGVGMVIAGMMGLTETNGTDPTGRDDIYYVLARTITAVQARERRIFGVDDMYGAVVEKMEHVDKSILHPTLDKIVPGFYSHEFARSVQDVTLPGVTIFSRETAEAALRTLEQQGLQGRLKISDESDGNGQTNISGLLQLNKELSKIPVEKLRNKGVVLEARVKDDFTLSVGEVIVAGQKISFLARQKSDIAPEDGRSRYKGAVAKIVRGGMECLGNVISDPIEKLAVEKGIIFHASYSYFNPITSRISYDVLNGVDDRGRFLAGVTDITARLGGTCPALAEALKVFDSRPEIDHLVGEVTLNYNPKDILPEEQGAAIYVDTPTLRLTAKVLNLEGREV